MMTETRASKAQRLVDEDRVSILFVRPLHVLAAVVGDHRTRQTTLYANGHFACSCEWGRIHSYTDDLCAHALALRLLTEKKN